MRINIFNKPIFANAKINIGLKVINKRPDGFHNIETIMYPIPLFDIIEWKQSNNFKIITHGLPIKCKQNENLIFKVYHLLLEQFDLPPLEIHLLKNIPVGAGLGGGSSDAIFFLSSVNEIFQLGIDKKNMKSLSLKIGTDCPFFIKNEPAFVTHLGEQTKSIFHFLKGYYLLIIYTDIKINTTEAYTIIKPKINNISLTNVNLLNPKKWKKLLQNDFEVPIFKKYPLLKTIKEKMYQSEAIYASMTGSGSAIYGVFNNKVLLPSIKMFSEYHSILLKL